MDKAKAISIITKCVPLYDVMSQSDYIFIYSKDGHSAEYAEVNFPKNNFLHLTGINYSGSASAFYRAAMNNKLNPKTLVYKNGTTILKLEVIRSLVKLPETARWIGDFDGSGVKLHTEMLAGNTCGCMGFVRAENSDLFVPNTALKGDIRDVVTQPVGHIIATISKKKAIQFIQQYNM